MSFRFVRYSLGLLLVVACSEPDEGGQLIELARRAEFVEQATPATAAERQEQVNEHIRHWHDARGHVILRTVQEEDGTVVDLVDADSVPGSKLKPPVSPPARQEGLAGEAPLPQVVHEGAGVPGIVRFVRPHLSLWVNGDDDSSSLAEYLQKVGKQPGTPTGNQRLYAGVSRSQSNMTGVDSRINMRWQGADVPGSGEFFLAQTSAMDEGASGTGDDEFVGWIIGRNPGIFDQYARLLTEFYSSGSTVGHFVGGWGACTVEFACYDGFIPADGAAYAIGDSVSGLSVVNGSQYSHRMLIQRDNNCSVSGCTGAYWVLYDSTWVGHYEIGSCTGCIPFNLIDNSFDTAHWYGEVYDATETNWTSTDMSSGVFPNASGSSWQQAGYFRLLGIQAGVGQPWTSPTVSASAGDDTDCYRGTIQYSTDTNWLTTLWFGGPGVEGSGCDPY